MENLEEEKLKKEIEKLSLEIKSEKNNFTKSISMFLRDLIIAFIPIVAGYFLLGGKNFFDLKEKELNTNKLLLEYETEKLNDRKDSLSKNIVGLNVKNDSLSKANSTINQEARALRASAENYRTQQKITFDLLDKQLINEQSKALNFISSGQFKIFSAYLDFDKANLNPKYLDGIEKVIMFLNDNPQAVLNIRGYYSYPGSDTYNIMLSEKITGNVSRYFTSKGIAPERIKSQSYGKLLFSKPENLRSHELEMYLQKLYSSVDFYVELK